MDGRIFAKFHVDVGIGDEVTEPVELVHGGDWLSFAGISPPQFLSLSREQQWAEKFHAYTRPRPDRTNSRAKDLIDLLLLIRSGDLAPGRMLECVRATFERRQTHPLPAEMPPPPTQWARTFAALAEEVGVEVNIEAGYRIVSEWWQRVRIG
jgi:hypothetical protein